MADHRRRGHRRQGRPVRPTTVRGQPSSSDRARPEPPSSDAAKTAATEHSWGDQPSIDELIEGPVASEGFAAERREFAAATRQVAEATGLSHEQVIHDYWLVRSLHALSGHLPADGVLRRSGGQWAFGGGTSLTAAWRFVRRYSEDIDGVLLVDDAHKGQDDRQRNDCAEVARWAADDFDIGTSVPSEGRVLTSHFRVGETARYIKFETSIIESSASDLVVAREITSLMHEHGDPSWASEHPEIGGFALPCLHPAWIAVNKFDALHRRAAAGNLRGLHERGRDLYDLWALSVQRDIADEIRRRAPELWDPAARGLGRHGTPRPPGGYADSRAFVEGTDEYEALRAGYNEIVETTVWGPQPRFETAVKAARALDEGDLVR